MYVSVVLLSLRVTVGRLVMIGGSFRQVGMSSSVGSCKFGVFCVAVICGFIDAFEWIWNVFVVVVDDLFSVIHAAVTDLDWITIKDFSKFVLFREVLVY